MPVSEAFALQLLVESHSASSPEPKPRLGVEACACITSAHGPTSSATPLASLLLGEAEPQQCNRVTRYQK